MTVNIKKVLIVVLITLLLLALGFIGRLAYEGHRSRTMNSPFDNFTNLDTLCPESPNCVSTWEDPKDKIHFIQPESFEINPIPEIKRISEMMGLSTVRENSNSLALEHKSQLFGFVDDIVFIWNEEGTLHMKSASRVGHSDLEANRKRLNGIVFQLKQSRK